MSTGYFARIGATAATMFAAVAAVACGDITYGNRTQAPPPTAVRLKDVTIPNLPSPYYHFTYDDLGRVSTASFASDLRIYDVTYDGDRITKLQNDAAGNHDRLDYTYDEAGRAVLVKYVDNVGLYVVVALKYNGDKLVELERSRRVADVGFIINKTLSFSYYADGNLRSIVDHRPPVDGFQDESEAVTVYSGYDATINVDAFSLIHDDFFDHLVLLPGVQLQKGNPAHEVRTGTALEWTVDYTYTFDADGRPLVKTGDLTFTSGQNAGQKFQTRSEFSYY